MCGSKAGRDVVHFKNNPDPGSDGRIRMVAHQKVHSVQSEARGIPEVLQSPGRRITHSPAHAQPGWDPRLQSQPTGHCSLKPDDLVPN